VVVNYKMDRIFLTKLRTNIVINNFYLLRWLTWILITSNTYKKPHPFEILDSVVTLEPNMDFPSQFIKKDYPFEELIILCLFQSVKLNEGWIFVLTHIRNSCFLTIGKLFKITPKFYTPILKFTLFWYRYFQFINYYHCYDQSLLFCNSRRQREKVKYW